MQICDIVEKGTRTDGLKAVVAGLEQKMAKNNKPYLVGTLMDPTGVIPFKVWENVAPMATILAPGNAVEIKSGLSDDYGDVISIRIVSATVLPTDEIETLIQNAPIEFETLKKKIEAAFEATSITPLIEKLDKKGLWDNFLKVPGAMRHHHVYRHGLLQHTLEVYETAMFLADMQKTYHGLSIDKQALGIAALLHDIGKIYEYDISPLGLFVKFNEKGELLGHHFLSANLAWQALPKIIEPSQVETIAHCILSHHGRLEWGAAVVPKTPEAYILHLSDMASSQPVGAATENKPLY